MLARTLKRVAAVLNDALEITGGATDTAQLLEFIVIRLQFRVGHTPVLDAHVAGQGFFAVTFQVMAAHAEIAREKTPALTVPVHA